MPDFENVMATAAVAVLVVGWLWAAVEAFRVPHEVFASGLERVLVRAGVVLLGGFGILLWFVMVRPILATRRLDAIEASPAPRIPMGR